MGVGLGRNVPCLVGAGAEAILRDDSQVIGRTREVEWLLQLKVHCRLDLTRAG